MSARLAWNTMLGLSLLVLPSCQSTCCKPLEFVEGPRGDRYPRLSSIALAETAPTLEGRPFVLSGVLYERRPAYPKTAEYGLTINGDGRSVCLTNAGAFPGLVVEKDALVFGAHRFQATATPGAYVIDVRALDLPEGGTHCVRDGHFTGTATSFDDDPPSSEGEKKQ